MSSVHIRSRTVGDGSRRHDVRYRRGGRYFPVEHAGTFHTVKEANLRAGKVREWIAAGLDPKDELARLLAVAVERRLADVAVEWLATRRRLEPGTLARYRNQQAKISKRFGTDLVERITVADVNAWVTELDAVYKPGTVVQYVSQLRQILDFADVTPNPARDRRVELPRETVTDETPPDAAQVLAAIRRMPFRHREIVVFLEQTGARVTEACELERAQVDERAMRVLFRAGTNKSRRARWVDLPDWLIERFDARDGRLFDARTRGAVYQAVKDGGADWHPHDLRHRRASLWHQQGVPAVELARRLGHAKPSMSLDRYSHVMPLDEIPVQDLVRSLRYASTAARRT